ncbi:hypothetical protein CAPTEDRAFT_204550 [Capitella teleta]|uniref:Uncharacterized protein n=1 Tax=Capitella teleta TaxID=283909 RepID=R7VHC7_CAPTE|nr:hypothetical protein CAPTEDRAFT_204550 [Capitella teleta]|eukprot:ELU17987.1 hypothetical protein CAPTEDRAFT_204550 [Capitella teleta]
MDIFPIQPGKRGRNTRIIKHDSNSTAPHQERLKKTAFKRKPQPLPCIYINARGMRSVSDTSNKLVDLRNLTSAFDDQMVTITETWFSDVVLDCELLDPPQFTVHCKDRSETSSAVADSSLASPCH